MVFKYKAVTNTGETVEGTFEGQSTDEVLYMLKGKNYLPVSVEELNEREIKSGITLGTNVKKKEDRKSACRERV